MTVLVVRHGETPWTREGRVQGWAAVPLTERGREQARAAGRHVASDPDHGPDRLVASDLRRTKETATLVADELDLTVATDPDWRERHFGQYQGFSDERYERVREGGSEAAADGLDVGETATYGESWADLHDRVDDAWDRLDHAGETVVVVTHNGPVWRLSERFTGEPRRIEAGEVLVVGDGDSVRGVVSPTDRES